MDSKKMETFRDLVVWQKSHGLVLDIFKMTQKFPKKEQASLVPLMREKSTALPIQIAHGFNKRGRKPTVHFYRNALNSIEEIRYLIILSHDLGYIKSADAQLEECDNIERMLKRLIRSVASPS